MSWIRFPLSSFQKSWVPFHFPFQVTVPASGLHTSPLDAGVHSTPLRLEARILPNKHKTAAASVQLYWRKEQCCKRKRRETSRDQSKVNIKQTAASCITISEETLIGSKREGGNTVRLGVGLTQRQEKRFSHFSPSLSLCYGYLSFPFSVFLCFYLLSWIHVVFWGKIQGLKSGGRLCDFPVARLWSQRNEGKTKWCPTRCPLVAHLCHFFRTWRQSEMNFLLSLRRARKCYLFYYFQFLFMFLSFLQTYIGRENEWSGAKRHTWQRLAVTE